MVGTGRSGCGDIYGTTPEAAVEAVLDALRQATGGDLDDVRATLCLAGIDWQSDEDYWREQLATHAPSLADAVVLNDGFAVLAAGRADLQGVAVSAGTGPSVVSRGPAGEWSTSFWFTHDLGASGLAHAALTASMRAELGMGPDTLLSDALCTHFGQPTVAALLEARTARFHRDGGLGRAACARASRAVLDAADGGDSVAMSIVDDQARSFASYAELAARRAGFRNDGSMPVPIVLGGSVLAGSPSFRQRVIDEISHRLPAARCALQEMPPLLGAVWDSLSRDGAPPSVYERLTETPLPDPLLLT